MEVSTKTWNAFKDAKCRLVSVDENQTKMVFDAPNNKLIILFPERNRLRVHKIIRRDQLNNMPIVDYNLLEHPEIIVENNKHLISALESVKKLKK